MLPLLPSHHSVRSAREPICQLESEAVVVADLGQVPLERTPCRSAIRRGTRNPDGKLLQSCNESVEARAAAAHHIHYVRVRTLSLSLFAFTRFHACLITGFNFGCFETHDHVFAAAAAPAADDAIQRLSRV